MVNFQIPTVFSLVTSLRDEHNVDDKEFAYQAWANTHIYFSVAFWYLLMRMFVERILNKNHKILVGGGETGSMYANSYGKWLLLFWTDIDNSFIEGR